MEDKKVIEIVLSSDGTHVAAVFDDGEYSWFSIHSETGKQLLAEMGE